MYLFFIYRPVQKRHVSDVTAMWPWRCGLMALPVSGVEWMLLP